MTRLRLRGSSGLTLVADAWGPSGGHAVLLLHGGGQTRHAWGGTAEALAAAGHRAVALDMRGHGESDWSPEGAYELDDFAGDIIAVAEQLGGHVTLVGASLGGLSTLHAVERRPDLVRGVVMVDIAPRTQPRGVRRILDFMQARPDGFGSLEEAADAVAAYLPHRKRPEDLSGLERSLRRGDDGRYRWHWDPQLLETWDRERSTEERAEQIGLRLRAARSLTVPTLLVRGRMSDVINHDNVEEFLSLVPHAAFVDLEGASHMVAGDRNDRFTEVIVSFLEEGAIVSGCDR